MNWKPIESAPHDTPVLVCAKGEVATTAQFKSSWKDWSLIEAGGYAEDSDISYTPTHWMPIPEFDQ